MKKILALVLLLAASSAALKHQGVFAAWQDRADANPWEEIPQTQFNRLAGERSISPVKSRGLRLNRAALAEQLKQAPLERTPEAAARPLLLPLPYPDGTFKTFRVVESPIMEPELAAKFPDIKTYFPDTPEDPAARARFDLTPQGFHAMILSDKPTILIDPPIEGNTEYYLSYYKGDLPQTREAWQCDVKPEISAEPSPEASFAPAAPAIYNDTNLRTYRLAVAATGEFTAAHGGTVASGLSAVTTIVNRLNAVFERDLAVRLALVANNDQIIYTNAATDPYNGNLSVNQTNLDNVIGTANYDIGHLFELSQVSGGVAVGMGSPGSACSATLKGLAYSSGPTSERIYKVAAHEFGHQFGARHTFNGTGGACGNNRDPLAAYEPGSGSTILSYGGNCQAENLQATRDDYFHVNSLREMTNYIVRHPLNPNGGGNCATQSATGNTRPSVSAGNSFTIPIQTPFTLTATGSDPNGDALTYCWEQFNLGAASPPNTDDGTRPIFRSFPPTSDRSRTFPQWSDILNNTTTLGESLPTTTRTLTFQVTARDNRAGGGAINSATVNIATTDTAGPFRVTSPNTAVTWASGTTQTVTWDVANTDLSPVNCANVKITLSIDGGLSFPFTLLDSAPNTGSAEVIAPVMATTQARIKVEAAGNIFFDVSNTNFTIANSPPTLSGATIARQQGSPASTAQLATVGDANQACDSLSVSAAPATGSGVTLSGISVNTSCQVTASVAASCTATNSTFSLTVTDNQGATATSLLTVNVTNNATPSLGAYPATGPINAGAGATVTPSTPPSDNGVLASLTATAPGFSGTFAVNPTTGVMTITNANPPGSYTVTVTATDNCGAQAARTFTLTVAATGCSVTVDPATVKQPYVAVPYVELLSASPAANPGSYTFSVSAGALAPGLQLVTALGVTSIAGLPTAPGTYSFTIEARKNGTTCEGTRNYTVTIPATVVPILECVQRNPNNTYTARFGYNNLTGAAVTIPVGANNYFTPGNQNRGQTTVFQPGRVTNAFSVTFTKGRSNNLAVWFLRGPDGVLRPVSVPTTSFGCP